VPRSLPDADALLEAAVRYLESELLPTLSGYHRFQCRVAVNVLQQARREHALGPAQARAEAARLQELLGRDGDVEALSRDLAARIRAGEFALDDPALLRHLRLSLEEALRINNPRWLGG